jgi:hypothetical protein
VDQSRQDRIQIGMRIDLGGGGCSSMLLITSCKRGQISIAMKIWSNALAILSDMGISNDLTLE